MLVVKLCNKTESTAIIKTDGWEFTLPDDCSTILRLSDGIYSVLVDGDKYGKFTVSNLSLESSKFAVASFVLQPIRLTIA